MYIVWGIFVGLQVFEIGDYNIPTKKPDCNGILGSVITGSNHNYQILNNKFLYVDQL